MKWQGSTRNCSILDKIVAAESPSQHRNEKNYELQQKTQVKEKSRYLLIKISAKTAYFTVRRRRLSNFHFCFITAPPGSTTYYSLKRRTKRKHLGEIRPCVAANSSPKPTIEREWCKSNKGRVCPSASSIAARGICFCGPRPSGLRSCVILPENKENSVQVSWRYSAEN